MAVLGTKSPYPMFSTATNVLSDLEAGKKQPRSTGNITAVSSTATRIRESTTSYVFPEASMRPHPVLQRPPQPRGRRQLAPLSRFWLWCSADTTILPWIRQLATHAIADRTPPAPAASARPPPAPAASARPPPTPTGPPPPTTSSRRPQTAPLPSRERRRRQKCGAIHNSLPRRNYGRRQA